VANALALAFDVDEAWEQDPLPLPPLDDDLDDDLAEKLAQTKDAIEKLAEKSKVPLVLAYHVMGTNDWCLFSSHHYSLDEAAEALINYVKGGMDLELI
jgi:hypothetical protein